MKLCSYGNLLCKCKVLTNDKNIILYFSITGGELFERVIDDNFDLDEARCGKFMKEILQGVDYIHSQKVLHLDLKVRHFHMRVLGFMLSFIN